MTTSPRPPQPEVVEEALRELLERAVARGWGQLPAWGLICPGVGEYSPPLDLHRMPVPEKLWNDAGHPLTHLQEVIELLGAPREHRHEVAGRDLRARMAVQTCGVWLLQEDWVVSKDEPTVVYDGKILLAVDTAGTAYMLDTLRHRPAEIHSYYNPLNQDGGVQGKALDILADLMHLATTPVPEDKTGHR